MPTQLFNLETDNGEVHGALIQRFLNPLPEFQLLTIRDEERAAAKEFVRERYKSAYSAEVRHFLPYLMTMQCLGHYSGVAGLAPAGAQPLFLEQYLSAPVEQVLAASTGAPVSRSKLVEVGNLVAARKGASHLLFLLFTAVLHEAGYEWITFTATHALRNNLEKLGLPLLTLKEVEVDSLPTDVRNEWGSYYATEPMVMAANLGDIDRLVNSKALYRRIARVYRERIRALAAIVASKDAYAA